MNSDIQFIPEGATPIEPDDLADLIPSLKTRQELNQFEQRNIAKALIWARRSRKLRKNLLNIESLKLLHQMMFNETWQWAGRFRTRQTNIGVEPYQISTQLANLCADAQVWIEHKMFSSTTFAVRFHYRLVSIHPFINGNGRHSRLVADLLMIYASQPPFRWGGKSLDVEGETRAKYLAALKEADKGNYNDLIRFALAQ
jgi:Fic-DOC domain mobile mystery protein B